MRDTINKWIDFFRDKVRSLKEIKALLKELGKDETREMIAFVLMEGLRFLKTCRIRKAKGSIYFSIEDPATMGQVLEGVALVYPFIQDKITLVPEFGDSYYYGDIRLEGKIRLIHLLILLIRLLRNRAFRRLVLKGGKHGK